MVILYILGGLMLIGLGYGACVLINKKLFKKLDKTLFIEHSNVMAYQMIGEAGKKRRRYSAFGLQAHCRIGANSNLGKFIKKKQDAIIYEGSMLGKVVEITHDKKKILGKGILLSEQLLPEQDLIQSVVFFLYTEENEIVCIRTAIDSVRVKAGVNVNYLGENDAEQITSEIKDYCKNRCIMDCTDCMLKKYYKKRGDK